MRPDSLKMNAIACYTLQNYIITCNEKDYCNSEIPAVNPNDFLKALSEIPEKF